MLPISFGVRLPSPDPQHVVSISEVRAKLGVLIQPFSDQLKVPVKGVTFPFYFPNMPDNQLKAIHFCLVRHFTQIVERECPGEIDTYDRMAFAKQNPVPHSRLVAGMRLGVVDFVTGIEDECLSKWLTLPSTRLNQAERDALHCVSNHIMYMPGRGFCIWNAGAYLNGTWHERGLNLMTLCRMFLIKPGTVFCP